MKAAAPDSKSGLLYGIAAYGLWGAVPVYFKVLEHVPAGELLAQRVVWSTLLLIALTIVRRGWGQVLLCLRTPRTRRTLLLTTVLIAVNWFFYIYGVSTQRVMQTSLGYFVTPLASTALGVLVLGERLRLGQKIALALAVVSVVLLSWFGGEIPWIALVLAVSFGLYGLFRKTVAADALTGITVESIFLFPFALGYAIYLASIGTARFAHVDWQTDMLLAAASVVTVVPLYCFAQAARRLRLTTIGFLQYLSPTGQFILAIVLFHEPLDWKKLIGFAFVWLALVVYSADAFFAWRRLNAAPAVHVN